MGALPVLVRLTNAHDVPFSLRKVAFVILCHFVKTSPLTRKKLGDIGGPYVFLHALSVS